ncbi:MAG: hypothetical protein ACREJ2_13425, partial [Planctomycetota bacterium]
MTTPPTPPAPPPAEPPNDWASATPRASDTRTPDTQAPNTHHPRARSRSPLITAMLGIFIFFQIVAILADLLNLIWTHMLTSAFLLSMGLSCFQDLSIIAVVLAVATLALYRTKRYHPWARRLAIGIIAHCVIGLVLDLLVAGAIVVVTMAGASRAAQTGNMTGSLQSTLDALTAKYYGAYLVFQLFMVLFEAGFLAFAFVARNGLRASHFAAQAPS